MGARPQQSPPQGGLSPFIGRGAELHELRELLRGGESLVTVVGSPGIGKTRLVQQYMQVHGPDHPGGCYFCDLTETTEPDAVHRTVASVLGIHDQERRGADGATRVGQSLQSRGRVLLVLDNFEQSVRAAPATVARWQALAPEAQFLVTSRELLKLPAEVAFELEPLSLPDDDGDDSEAVRLFLDRARRVRRGFAPRGSQARAVTQIVRALDGIPLAIELAAVRMTVLDPTALLARLGDRFSLLRGEARGTGRWERSLRDAIDWSWELLTPWERSALAQCSVFRGGFSADAAEAVLDLSSEPQAPGVLDVLQALRDKSLVRAYEARGQLRLGLYLTIREYAAAQLDRMGATREARARHLEHYATAGARARDRLDRGREPEVRLELELEQENLLAAVEQGFASGNVERALRSLDALEPILSTRMPVAAHADLLAGALDRARVAGLEDVRLAPLLLALSRVLERSGRCAEGMTRIHEALAAARQGTDRRLLGRVLHWQAKLLLMRGDIADSEASYREASALHQETGDRRLELKTLASLGYIALEGGRPAQAMELAEQALKGARSLGDLHSEGETLYYRALVDHDRGALDGACHFYGESLKRFELLGETVLAAYSKMELGLALLEAGRLSEARLHLEGSEPLIRGVDPRFEGLLHAHLSALEAQEGRLVEASAHLARSEGLFEATDHLMVLAAVVGPVRGLLDLARARVAEDPQVALALEASARAHGAAAREASIRGADPTSFVPNMDLRMALRMLERELTDGTSAGAPDTRPRPVLIQRDGLWFQLPGGDRVSCKRRLPLRRLLVRLARARLEEPGRQVSRRDLLSAGWQGERMTSAAAANRLNVTVFELRKLGLKAVLLGGDEGYLLDPKVPVILVGDLISAT